MRASRAPYLCPAPNSPPRVGIAHAHRQGVGNDIEHTMIVQFFCWLPRRHSFEGGGVVAPAAREMVHAGTALPFAHVVSDRLVCPWLWDVCVCACVCVCLCGCVRVLCVQAPPGEIRGEL
jgi:hypothetical protein